MEAKTLAVDKDKGVVEPAGLNTSLGSGMVVDGGGGRGEDGCESVEKALNTTKKRDEVDGNSMEKDLNTTEESDVVGDGNTKPFVVGGGGGGGDEKVVDNLTPSKDNLSENKKPPPTNKKEGVPTRKQTRGESRKSQRTKPLLKGGEESTTTETTDSDPEPPKTYDDVELIQNLAADNLRGEEWKEKEGKVSRFKYYRNSLLAILAGFAGSFVNLIVGRGANWSGGVSLLVFGVTFLALALSSWQLIGYHWRLAFPMVVSTKQTKVLICWVYSHFLLLMITMRLRDTYTLGTGRQRYSGILYLCMRVSIACLLVFYARFKDRTRNY